MSFIWNLNLITFTFIPFTKHKLTAGNVVFQFKYAESIPILMISELKRSEVNIKIFNIIQNDTIITINQNILGKKKIDFQILLETFS